MEVLDTDSQQEGYCPEELACMWLFLEIHPGVETSYSKNDEPLVETGFVELIGPMAALKVFGSPDKLKSKIESLMEIADEVSSKLNIGDDFRAEAKKSLMKLTYTYGDLMERLKVAESKLSEKGYKFDYQKGIAVEADTLNRPKHLFNNLVVALFEKLKPASDFRKNTADIRRHIAAHLHFYFPDEELTLGARDPIGAAIHNYLRDLSS